MSRHASRRGVLRGRSTLPVIGGGVASIGAGNADAKPILEGSPEDAELLILGREFEELREKYEAAESELERLDSSDPRLQRMDDKADDLATRLQPVMHKIARLKASTPAGQRVKLLAWEHCNYATGEDINDLIETECTNDRLKLSILRDMLAQYGIEQRQLNAPTTVTF